MPIYRRRFAASIVVLLSVGFVASANADPSQTWELECSKGNSLSCLRRGLVDFDANQFETARQWFQKGCDKANQDSCFNKTIALEKLGQIDAAAVSYESMCARNYASACNNYGVLLRDQRKDFVGAEKAFSSGCNSGIKEACVNLSNLSFSSKRTPQIDEAMKVSRKKSCESDRVATSCEQIAYSEELAGRTEEARRLFKLGCDLKSVYSCDRLKNLDDYKAPGTDPFAQIEKLTLANGLMVYLAHSPLEKNLHVSVTVGAGTNQETATNHGVAHVLEHVVFRDPEHGKPSHLDVFQRESANSNAVTTSEDTIFYAQMPSFRGKWMMTELSELFQKRQIDPSVLQKAKAEVELEAGTLVPSFLQKFVSQNQSFYRREFGVTEENNALFSVDQGVKLLKVSDVDQFFDKYYHPANMVIFVVGNFDREELIQTLNETFGKMPPSTKSPRTESPVKPRLAPYLVSVVSHFKQFIQIGTKTWDLNEKDKMILEAYIDSLTDSLMRELRTEKGETYTVSRLVEMDTRRFGIMAINFEAPKNSYEKNLNYVREKIKAETSLNGLSDDRVLEIINVYLRGYSKWGQDIRSLLFLTESLYFHQKAFPESKSPYEALKSVAPQEFRERLHKLFQDQRRYEVQYRPPLLFPFDTFVLRLVFLALGFGLIRRRVSGGKNLLPPPRGVSRMVISAGLVLSWTCIVFLAYSSLLSLDLFYSNFMVRDYLYGVVSGLLTGFVFAAIRYRGRAQGKDEDRTIQSLASDEHPMSKAA